MDKREAEGRLRYCADYGSGLLGDRVLQNAAWQVADQLGWHDTFNAEYIALTQLHADAFITLDRQLAHAVKGSVTVAPIGARPERIDLHAPCSERRSCRILCGYLGHVACGDDRGSRRSGWSLGTSTRTIRAPSGSSIHISVSPQGSVTGGRRMGTPAAVRRSCSA